jgi:hypothetical protein
MNLFNLSALDKQNVLSSTSVTYKELHHLFNEDLGFFDLLLVT